VLASTTLGLIISFVQSTENSTPTAEPKRSCFTDADVLITTFVTDYTSLWK